MVSRPVSLSIQLRVTLAIAVRGNFSFSRLQPFDFKRGVCLLQVGDKCRFERGRLPRRFFEMGIDPGERPSTETLCRALRPSHAIALSVSPHKRNAAM